MENNEKEKKSYELGVLVRSESELPAIASFLKEQGAEIITDFRARRLALAYPIKKEKEAFFAYTHFSASGEIAKSLEHDVRVRPDVLRSLITILPKVKEQTPREMPRVEKRTTATRSTATETRHAPQPLSNEALEKKIEEILK